MNIDKSGRAAWKVGDEAWLAMNDCFGTRLHVRVLSLHKAGTVHLKELNGGKNFVNNISNLSNNQKTS